MEDEIIANAELKACWRRMWSPTLRKNREERDTTDHKKKRESAGRSPVLTVQGFTQKHPNWLHLRTSPGMQRITLAPDEIRGLLTFGAWAFDAMSGVHSRATAMKSLLKLTIFIKSSLDFFAGYAM